MTRKFPTSTPSIAASRPPTIVSVRYCEATLPTEITASYFPRVPFNPRPRSSARGQRLAIATSGVMRETHSMAQPFPARLHGLLARDAPVGVVLRRGPSNAVATFLWDRATDTFQLGQWVRARVYERRSDLSPDGRHLIYFARTARWQSETKGSYTAISRAPWLKAVALFGKGDCWNGGGLFTTKDCYWLNDGCGHFTLHDSAEVRRDEKFRAEGGYGGECLSVYYPRLLRDGWSRKEPAGATISERIDVFEKPLPQGWVLRKYAHADVDHPVGTSCYWDTHELDHPALGRRLTFPKWEWAERDGETLVWAEEGRLHRAALDEAGLEDARVLYDFNEMKFEARPAPY